MSIVISPGFVLSDSLSGGGIINGDNPIIGWHNRAVPANIAADTEADGFPASNMGNPSTNLRWVGADVSPQLDEHVTIQVNSVDDLDYIAIARHNLGSGQIPVSVEYLDPDASPENWEELIAPVLLADDGPTLFRFPPQALVSIRLRLQPGAELPTIATIYTGKLLVLQRRIYVGHTPMPFGRTTKITNARSESGNFLGRIVLNQMTGTSVSLKNLTPSWYRTFMEPFLRQAQERPFFFAWRPQSYPHEVGYAWLTNDPQPTNQLANGMMSVDLQMNGVV
jgi:hypothetical protein